MVFEYLRANDSYVRKTEGMKKTQTNMVSHISQNMLIDNGKNYGNKDEQIKNFDLNQQKIMNVFLL